VEKVLRGVGAEMPSSYDDRLKKSGGGGFSRGGRGGGRRGGSRGGMFFVDVLLNVTCLCFVVVFVCVACPMSFYMLVLLVICFVSVAAFFSRFFHMFV
jgi:hypothetical protein